MYRSGCADSLCLPLPSLLSARQISARTALKEGSCVSSKVEVGFHSSHCQKLRADLASPGFDCGSFPARPPMKHCCWREPDSYLGDVPGSGLAPAGSSGKAASTMTQLSAQASRGVEGLLGRPGLHETVSATTMRRRIHWTVPASKLSSKDTQVSSPSFNLACGGSQLPFKLVVYPREKNRKKGGASFRNSGGRAEVKVKCNGNVTAQGTASTTFWIYAGSDATAQPAADPVTHDFWDKALCPLAEDLDLASVTDTSSSTFTVCVEVLE